MAEFTFTVPSIARVPVPVSTVPALKCITPVIDNVPLFTLMLPVLFVVTPMPLEPVPADLVKLPALFKILDAPRPPNTPSKVLSILPLLFNVPFWTLRESAAQLMVPLFVSVPEIVLVLAPEAFKAAPKEIVHVEPMLPPVQL